jgi:hypothetical protein
MKNGMEIDFCGNKFWYKNGLIHRENEPAIEWVDNGKAWCYNGKYHKEDGPACKYASGVEIWFLDDINYGYKKPDNWDELIKISRAKRLCDL